ncbi:hypothetical protein GCM10027280_43620 [Micromonospora polyrhachis]|uniref:DUF1579 domain-containing protein n=1 Tax=Micromonospora polyrhachis TaxID=1282883 RepID=A0A7W7SW08_9ACTN|nr:hypothetical protein [Micromonospora polyrhachis]MBB4961377.1 hypothetical protein [Micromonospora polyrhachis]
MTSPPIRQPGVGDFDFLVGSWEVTNRRLVRPLTGSTEWDEFPATAVCHAPLFGGAANLDEITFHTKGFTGLTLRLFDPELREWSLNWVNSRTGRLTPPVVGRFDADGAGEFYGDDTHEGIPIRCRFTWSGITRTSAHWEQAFSTDGGHSWETNWTMALTRTGEAGVAA